MMQYAGTLRNMNNQSTSICRQIIRVDIEVKRLLLRQYYFSPPDIGMYFSVNTMHEI